MKLDIFTAEKKETRRMKKYLAAIMGGIFIILAMTEPGQAHSLEYIEEKLAGKGEFFQNFDRKMPGFELQDANGVKVASKSFAGKIIVLYFTKAGCQTDCPALTQKIAEVQSMVNITPMRDLVQFVAVVADQDGDTPDTMRQHAVDAGVSPSNWTFLTGGSGQSTATRQLMKAFGGNSGTAVDRTRAKNAVIHVIGMKGRWRADFNGLNFQSIDLVLYINALMNFGNGVKDGHGK